MLAMDDFAGPRHSPSRRRLLLCALAAFGSGLASSVQAAYLVRAWEAAKPVPKLELSDLSGKPWRLADTRGQVVVMNFWATWCEPCRAEMPSLELLAQRHERDDVTVVAINYQEPLPAIRRFLDAQPVTLPILLDRDGAAANAWTPKVFPTTVLIDRKGQPRHVVLGELDWTSAAARDLVGPLVAAAKG